MTVRTCFSSWISRPNPDLNPGLINAWEVTEIPDAVSVRQGASGSLTSDQVGRCRTLLDVCVLLATGHGQPGLVRSILIDEAARFCGVPALALDPDIPLYDRVYD